MKQNYAATSNRSGYSDPPPDTVSVTLKRRKKKIIFDLTITTEYQPLWQKFHCSAHSTSQANLDTAYNRRNPCITSLKQQEGVKIWLQHSHAGLSYWKRGQMVREGICVCSSAICSIIWLVSKQILIWRIHDSVQLSTQTNRPNTYGSLSY